MKTLISAQEVMDLAFSTFDHATAPVIKETKIMAAQEKHLRPALGELYNAIIQEHYPEFVNAYIKPALAYFVRHAMLPDISVQIGNASLQTAYTGHSNAASDKQREMLRTQALDDARSLLDVAIRHVENNPDQFPEYQPRQSVQHKGVFAGGILLY